MADISTLQRTDPAQVQKPVDSSLPPWKIRPLQRADLPEVQELLDSSLSDWKGDTEFLAATLLDDPWADDELPSLVAVDGEDAVLGFVGAQIRRIRVRRRKLQGVCVSHLIVAPQARGTGIGSTLIQTLMTGPQAATWTDAAAESVVRMSRPIGGQVDHARTCDWMIPLRPGRWLAGIAADVIRRRDLDRGQIPVGALPLKAMVPGGARRQLPGPAPGVTSEAVETGALVEHLPEIMEVFEFHVDYDQRYLDHLFAQIESMYGGLEKRLVRHEGSPIGWYAQVPRESGATRVLHLAASSEGEMRMVLDELIARAWEQGRSVIGGRAGPHMRAALRDRSTVLGFSRQPLIHSRDPELRAILATGSSLLTQLDGEWFLV